ncbi:MAG: poly(A) polymerase [Myxococcota bacterium]|jgi:poly(A) polymerase
MTCYSTPVKGTPTIAPFPAKALDPDAVAIVARLQQAGHESFLVGGCVRDFLLGREPKDFDIATDARPEQLKRIFGRRCRIIGRRFKLAHVHAGPKMFEVATFRGPPADQETGDDDTGVVVRANTFGTPKQDAFSRDFTVNGLFYDPLAKTIIDWVGGCADIERRTLRTIGDAETRLREDPVRLLRAIKFGARLGFEIDGDIRAVSADIAPLIDTCPTARVTEELFRIAESGHAVRASELLTELGILNAIVPEISADFVDGAEGRDTIRAWLGQLDRMTQAHGTLPRASTFTYLAWPFVARALMTQEDPFRLEWGKFTRDFIHDISVRLSLPIRHRQALQVVADLQRRLLAENVRRPSRGQLRSRHLPLALAIARSRYLLDGTGRDAYEMWSKDAQSIGVWGAPFEARTDAPEDGDSGDANRENASQPPKKRRRRRRRPPEEQSE